MAKKKAAKKVKAAKKKKRITAAQLMRAAKNLTDTYEINENKEQAEALLTMRRLCDGLAPTTGIKTIVFSYNGEGDSGSIEEIIFEPTPKTPIPERLKDQLEQCAWAFIPSGFENNEGGYGQLIVNIPDGTISLEHSERIVETNDTEEEFEF